MPLNANGEYTAPTFVNDGPPALNASEMNALAGAAAGAVEFDRAQTLSDAQKAQAIANMGALGTAAQSLTVPQQQQAAGNIGAVSVNPQGLSTAQKNQAAANIGAVTTQEQTLSAAQKAQVIANIGAATRQLLTATLSTEWTGSAAPYTQTVAVAGVLETDAPVIDLAASETPATAEAELESYGLIYLITTANGSITAYASDKPGTALTLQLLIVR